MEKPNETPHKGEAHLRSDKKYFDWLYDGKGGQARIWSGIKWKNY